MYKVIPISKAEAKAIAGSCTKTSKMPCESYSLPTEACHTGFKMAQIKGSICASCYADKGFYKVYENNVKPAQFARLDAVQQAMHGDNGAWVSAMVAHIGDNSYFRWHDSGDLQGVEHLRLIAAVCEATPHTKHWLPTREYSMVKQYIEAGHKIPGNLVIRLSAMFVDKPVIVPKSLQGIEGILTSEVHQNSKATAYECVAPKQQNTCGNCRACFNRDSNVSYAFH